GRVRGGVAGGAGGGGGVGQRWQARPPPRPWGAAFFPPRFPFWGPNPPIDNARLFGSATASDDSWHFSLPQRMLHREPETGHVRRDPHFVGHRAGRPARRGAVVAAGLRRIAQTGGAALGSGKAGPDLARHGAGA